MKTYRTLVRVFLFFFVAGAAAACVDPAYDFDRTDRSVTVPGETVTLPLGDTGPLTVESLLGDKLSDYLVPLSDGTVSIQYKGSPFNFTFDELKKIDGAAPFARYCDYPISYGFSMFDKPANPAFNGQGEADLSGSVPAKVELKSLSKSIDINVSGLPKELAALKSMTLSSKSRIEITVSVPSGLFTAGTVTPDLTFDLGTFFTSDDFPGGLIKLNTPLSADNSYSVTHTIHLNKLAFDPKSFDPAEHTLNVATTLKFTGTCAIAKPKTNREHYDKAPKDIQLQITVIMREIACQEIEGSFDYSRKTQVTFPLGSFTAGLADKLNGDVFFDFMDPTILMDIESNISIPISSKMDLAARQNKVKFAEVKNIPIVFPVAKPGASASKRIRMAKNPPQNPGEEPIALDFTPLLSRIPDDMLITVNASTQKDKTAAIRIGENYKVNVTPQIILPLSFGPSTKVEARDTVSLPARLDEMIRDNTIRVVGQISNTFPLQLAFSLVMVDETGLPLTEQVHQTIAAGGTTEVALSVAKLPGAADGKLSAAVLSFEAEGIPESRPVKTDDAIEARLHIEIPGGYHLTL